MERKGPQRRAPYEFLYPVLAILLACSSGEKDQGAEVPNAVVTDITSSEPTLSAIIPLREQIENDLSQNGIIKKEEHDLTTKWPMPITIRNFTQMNLDVTAITSVYDTLADLTQPSSQLNSFPYELNGKEVTISLRPKFEEFVVNKISADIIGGVTTIDNYTGITEWNGGEIYAFSVASDVAGEGTASAYGTFTFDVEACQQVIFAQVIDRDGNPIEDELMRHDAQEIACNSIGHAMGARAIGATYEDYKLLEEDLIFGHRPLTITEEMFNSLPISGVIVKP